MLKYNSQSIRLNIYKGRKISNCAGGDLGKNLNCNQSTWVLATTHKPDLNPYIFAICIFVQV